MACEHVHLFGNYFPFSAIFHIALQKRCKIVSTMQGMNKVMEYGPGARAP